MRTLLTILFLLLPGIAHAQVPASEWRQNYSPTLADWRAALLYNGVPLGVALREEISRATAVEALKLNRNGDTSTDQMLETPVITGGTATGTNISAAAITSGGANNSVSSASALRRVSVFPEDFRLASDGTDDAPSIQRAMTSLCAHPGTASSGGVVELSARVYEMDSGVTIPCALSMHGQGWEEQMTRGGGSWLHIKTALGTTPAFRAATTFARGSVFSDFAISQDHPVPGKVAGTAWTPAIYGPVFDLEGVDAAVFFRHILWDGVYKGVYGNGAGRVEMDGMYAHVFDYLITIDGSEDVDRIRNIHLWPYWTNSTLPGDPITPAMTAAQQQNVNVYTVQNANGIILNRTDTPFLDEIFGIWMHSDIEIGSTRTGNAGTTTKAHIGRMSCDGNVYCLWITSAATAASAIIDQLDWAGENPASTGSAMAGGAAIKLDGAAFLQIGAVHAEFIGSSIFNFANTSICSEIVAGSIFGNFMYSPDTVPVAYMPSCASAQHTVRAGFYDGIPNIAGRIPLMVNGTGHFALPALNEQNPRAR